MQIPVSDVAGCSINYKYFLPTTNQVVLASRKEKTVLFDKCMKLNMQKTRTVVKMIKVSIETLKNKDTVQSYILLV